MSSFCLDILLIQVLIFKTSIWQQTLLEVKMWRWIVGRGTQEETAEPKLSLHCDKSAAKHGSWSTLGRWWRWGVAVGGGSADFALRYDILKWWVLCPLSTFRKAYFRPTKNNPKELFRDVSSTSLTLPLVIRCKIDFCSEAYFNEGSAETGIRAVPRPFVNRNVTVWCIVIYYHYPMLGNILHKYVLVYLLSSRIATRN